MEKLTPEEAQLTYNFLNRVETKGINERSLNPGAHRWTSQGWPAGVPESGDRQSQRRLPGVVRRVVPVLSGLRIPRPPHEGGDRQR